MNIKTTSLAVSLAILPMIPMGSAHAQAATDLQCVQCVGTGDIANNAVGTGKLKNAAVATGKLKNAAVSTAKIKTMPSHRTNSVLMSERCWTNLIH